MLRDLQNHPALVGANWLGVLSGFQREDLVLKLLGQCATLEVFEVATICRRRTAGIGFCQFVEFRAFLQLSVNAIGLGFGLGHNLVGGRSRLASSRSWRRGGNQNLAQTYLFRALHLAFVLVVELLNFLLRYRDVATDLLLNNLLGEDCFLQVLFELLKRDALSLSGFLQIFHRVVMHLLAQFVKTLDYVGISADSQFFSLL